MDIKQFLQELFDKHKVPILEFQGLCHDCQKETNVEIRMEDDGKVTISGGALYTPDDQASADIQRYLKCDSCYEKEPELSLYQECEIYSRVVGYLRPVKQWNPGKQEEFRLRKMLK